MLKKIAAIATIAGLLCTTSAQAGEAAQCLPPEKAEALFSYALPIVIGTARTQCADILPASAPLLREDSRQFQKYVTASDEAWPDAKDTIAIFTDNKLPADLDLDSLRPFVEAMIPAMLADEIKPKHCSTINRFYELLEPMPAQNLAAMTVMLVQLTAEDKKQPDADSDAEKARDKSNPFNICKPGEE